MSVLVDDRPAMAMGYGRALSAGGGWILFALYTRDVTKYLARINIRCRYIHSDIDTLERVEIMDGLRKGTFDALIGINLLREGLDLPEVFFLLDGPSKKVR